MRAFLEKKYNFLHPSKCAEDLPSLYIDKNVPYSYSEEIVELFDEIIIDCDSDNCQLSGKNIY